MRLILCLTICVTVFFCDQLVKFLIVEFVMQPPRAIPITSFFQLDLVFNEGASFGILADKIGRYPWIMASCGIVLVVALFAWALRVPSTREGAALSAMIGGAAGNIADRIHAGAVTDYLSVRFGTWAFPVFNLADVAIVGGAFGIILLELGRKRRKRLNATQSLTKG